MAHKVTNTVFRFFDFHIFVHLLCVDSYPSLFQIRIQRFEAQSSSKFNSYLKENTTLLCYDDGMVNAVREMIAFKLIDTLCRQSAQLLNVKISGVYSYQWALTIPVGILFPLLRRRHGEHFVTLRMSN
jgi:hypothetical protein